VPAELFFMPNPNAAPVINRQSLAGTVLEGPPPAAVDVLWVPTPAASKRHRNDVPGRVGGRLSPNPFAKPRLLGERRVALQVQEKRHGLTLDLGQDIRADDDGPPP
jgi:hypothetical protein